MSDRPYTSPDLKIYKSGIKLSPKQSTFGVTERILVNILSNRFSEASQLCTLYKNQHLRRITELCYEYYLLKYVMNQSRVIEKQNKLLTSNQVSKQFQPLLQKTIQLKECWANSKKYLEQIDAALQQIRKDGRFEQKRVSGYNEFQQKIKQSLAEVQFAFCRLEQERKKFLHEINLLNLAMNKQKINFENQNKANIVLVKQKNKTIQDLNNKNAKLDQTIKQMKQLQQLQSLSRQRQKQGLISQLEKETNQKQTLLNELSVSKKQQENINKKIKQLQVSEKNYIRQKKEMQEKLASKNESLNGVITQLEMANQNFRELQSCQQQNQNLIEQLRNKNDELYLQIDSLSLEINQLRANNHELQFKCENLASELNDHFTNYQTQTSNLSQLHEQQNQLKQNLELEQSQKFSLQTKVQDLQVELQRCKAECRQLQERQKQLDSQNETFNKELNQFQSKYMKLHQEYHLLKSQLENVNHVIEVESEETSVQTVLSLQDLNDIQNKVTQDQEIIKKTQHQIQELIKKKIKLEQSHEQISSKFLQLQSKHLALLKDIDLAQIQRKDLFFLGKVLDQENQGRQYLQLAIQKAEGKRIRKTTLIYRLDNLNKVNLHKYIDNIPNIVLLIKTETSWLVAGYSQGPFYSKMISNKNGILVSISGRNVFQLKVRNNRAISYDDFFVIFGNSQIRIKTQQYKLFSNFAISSAYYECRQQKVDVITGQRGMREVLIETFEFFQVEFY